MNTTNSQQTRSLTEKELEAVTGGMTAVFRYGDTVIEIYADASMHSVATTNLSTGQSTTRITL